MSKALAVVHVRHQVVPETEDDLEEGENVGGRGLRGGDTKKVITFSKQLHAYICWCN